MVVKLHLVINELSKLYFIFGVFLKHIWFIVVHCFCIFVCVSPPQFAPFEFIINKKNLIYNEYKIDSSLSSDLMFSSSIFDEAFGTGFLARSFFFNFSLAKI